MIKTDISKIYNETGNRIVNKVTENIALNEELRYRPSGTRIITNELGQAESIFDNGRLWGFDVETAEYSKLISYFTDARVTKRSESLKCHVLKYLMVRFPNETETDKLKLINVIKTISTDDFEILQSEAKDDDAWFGDSGIQNSIWKDPKNPINNKRVKVVKLKNDGYRIERK